MKFFILLLILIGTPLISLVLLNVRWTTIIPEGDVQEIKNLTTVFTSTHHNEFALFVEPDIESTFRAIDSINFSFSDVNALGLIDPRDNSLLPDYFHNFFFDYIFDKQNDDGSYSDIGGFGSLLSTYQAIKLLEILKTSFIQQKIIDGETTEIVNYLFEMLNVGGWGFRSNLYLNDSDIISTYCAIELAHLLSVPTLLSIENIARFINSTWNPLTGAYSMSNYSIIATPETTYYGVRAFLGLNMSYSLGERLLITGFLSSFYNPIDGGYINPQTGISDVHTTYYAITTIHLLGFSLTNAPKTLDFVLFCNNTQGPIWDRGGFGINPNINTSDFKSGWAAAKSLNLLENLVVLSPQQLSNIFTVRETYHGWIKFYQARNALFGQISIESNYFGVLTYQQRGYLEIIDNPQINAIKDLIFNYTIACYNWDEKGFGSQPGLGATLFATYCGLNLIRMLKPELSYNLFNLKFKPTIQFLADLQNSDGGFRAGNDVNKIFSLFGAASPLFKAIIDTNSSTIESTYWAIISLRYLEGFGFIDYNNLTHWVRSCQNADGGFSIIVGFHSDVISTYYGLQIFIENLVPGPMSSMAAIDFLKLAQTSDGSFSLLPTIGEYLNFPSSFLVTYMASKSLYDYRFQPENIKEALIWFAGCFSFKTGGLGDNPGFGADLRNSAYGLLIVDELKYDQSFNSKPWNQLLIYIILVEVGFLVLYILLIIRKKLSLLKRIKEKLGIGGKLTPSYLQTFSAINCENFSIYAGGKLIVDSVSMKVKHGQILGILGESGAGKSTFVKGLLGMRKKTGFCQIYGMNINKRTSKKIRPIYGYVPQDLGKIYHNFTTLENLLYFGGQYGLSEKDIISRSKRILRSLEIEDKTNELVKNLSGGQKRRVSIAIGLIHSPIFLILDEPTSGLDPIIRENLWLALTKINEQFSTTLIVITHYPEESRFCNRVAIFARNRGMIDFGNPRELLRQLPGKGRSIEVIFKDFQEDVIKLLESIEGIENVLENKAGTDYSLFTNLNLNNLKNKVEELLGLDSIFEIKQIDSKMEQYFRCKLIEVPEIEGV